jgi:hypothetical protein
MAILLTIAGITLIVSSAVLSVVFMFRHREKRWRMLPSICIISLPLIGVVPESGWSDVRSQWHQSALILPWSILALYLALVFLRSEKGGLSISLRIAFGTLGVAGFVGSILALVESWVFLHSF